MSTDQVDRAIAAIDVASERHHLPSVYAEPEETR